MDVNDLRAALTRLGWHHGDEAPLLHEVNQLAWRALALAQELHETYGDAPLAPGARLPERPQPVKSIDDPVVLIDYSHEFPLHGPAGADWRGGPPELGPTKRG